MIKEDEFAIDRTTSHPLENNNAYIRLNSLNYDTAINATRTSAKAQLIKQYEHELHSGVRINRRVNTGDARLRDEYNILSAPNMAPGKVADSLFILANADIKKKFS